MKKCKNSKKYLTFVQLIEFILMKRYFLSVFLFVLLGSSVRAMDANNLRISLLTVDPNPTAVYTIYGHTAIRIFNSDEGIDWVLNWGMFDRSAPNFLLRFIKGETDYYFEIFPYESFLLEYSWKNAVLTEQVLNIPDEQKQAFWEKIENNYRPENKEYRYNFLFDNCVTRPRDLIEQFCGGKLEYPAMAQPTTFRDLVHSCTYPYPWMSFGIDLLIGAGADSIIGLRSSLFLPVRLKDALDESSVLTAEGRQNIVNQSIPILSSKGTEAKSSWITPARFGWIMLIHALVLGLWGVWRRKRMALFFAPWFLVAGLVGCLLVFMTLFSEHPATSTNWNLLWLHPLHFIAFVSYFYKKEKRFFTVYHWISLVFSLLVVLVWPFIPQALNSADIPYILILAAASAIWCFRRGRSPH